MFVIDSYILVSEPPSTSVKRLRERNFQLEAPSRIQAELAGSLSSRERKCI